MIDSFLAALVVAGHAAFVAFVVLGGFLVLRWRRLIWLHLPAALYGVAIELGGWICPLTPLENHFRRRAGEGGYSGGFVEHYVVPLLYPQALSARMQFLVAAVVMVVNVIAYILVLKTGPESGGEAAARSAGITRSR